MRHPLEQTVDATLAALRQLEAEGPLASEVEIVPGLRLSFDTEQGRIAAHHAAGAGALLRLDLAVEAPGRWLSLNLSLGGVELAEGDVVGLVADLQASARAEIGLAIRSGRGKRFRDTAFADRLVTGPAGGVQAALLGVAAGTPLADPASWRSLMLRLPPESLTLEIRDMRVFVVPAAAASPAAAA